MVLKTDDSALNKLNKLGTKRSEMKQKTIDNILRQEGYSSGGAFLKDSMYLVALAKVEQYRAESEFFERKYKTRLQEFRQFLRSVKGKEDFTMEEDVEDWEFAEAALMWWEEKVKELKGV